MPTCYRAVLALVVLALWTIGVVSCSTEQARSTGGQVALGSVRARADTGVELHVVLPRDTISAHEHGPVEVIYYILNGPTKTAFDNAPDHYAFLVRNEDGAPAQAAKPGSATDAVWGAQVHMVLPAGALLGQVQDLGCVKGAGYDEPLPGHTHECEVSYPLTEPGTYNVIVMYRDGRVLADSAVLVVR